MEGYRKTEKTKTPRESPASSVVSFVYPDSKPDYWPETLAIEVGGKVVDLNQYLPKNGSVAFGPRWGVEDKSIEAYGNGVVVFSVEKIEKDPRMLLALLHEIGHAIVHANYNPAMRQRHLEARGGIPAEATLKDKSIILQNERDAWARALWIARDLRDNHGINVFSSFTSMEDVMLWLRSTSLDSYELHARFADESVVEEIKRFFSPRRGLSKDFLKQE
ncbi:MAG: hypothetical protein AAFO91_07560 [Bacteroidota bacterium]